MPRERGGGGRERESILRDKGFVKLLHCSIAEYE